MDSDLNPPDSSDLMNLIQIHSDLNPPDSWLLSIDLSLVRLLSESQSWESYGFLIVSFQVISKTFSSLLVIYSIYAAAYHITGD